MSKVDKKNNPEPLNAYIYFYVAMHYDSVYYLCVNIKKGREIYDKKYNVKFG